MGRGTEPREYKDNDAIEFDFKRLTINARGRGLRFVPVLIAAMVSLGALSLATTSAIAYLAADRSPAVTREIMEVFRH